MKYLSGSDIPRQFERKPCDMRSRHRVDKAVFRAYDRHVMPDLELHFKQGHNAFPRYRYPKPVNNLDSTDTSDALPGIGPECAGAYRQHFGHSVARRSSEHYRNVTRLRRTQFSTTSTVFCTRPDIVKSLQTTCQRMIAAYTFRTRFLRAFAEAGKALGELHLGLREV